jgi:hypothetical protein
MSFVKKDHALGSRHLVYCGLLKKERQCSLRHYRNVRHRNYVEIYCQIFKNSLKEMVKRKVSTDKAGKRVLKMILPSSCGDKKRR